MLLTLMRDVKPLVSQALTLTRVLERWEGSTLFNDYKAV